MPNIFFRKFGSSKEAFLPSEQALLHWAVDIACESLSLAYRDSQSKFAKHRVKLMLWFGDDSRETIDTVVKCLVIMQGLLRDPSLFLTFVDARYQTTYALTNYFEEVDEDFPTLEFNKYSWGTSERQDTSSLSIVAFVHRVFTTREAYIDKLAHYGSGMSIFITHCYFEEDGTPNPIGANGHCIIHELSHKMINTTDGEKDDQIYGVEGCTTLALYDTAAALANADNWAFFISSYNFKFPYVNYFYGKC
ncbi:MAG: hypothetical protein KAH18_03485 [Psychromonas sp.]|nr:hypothetical protein [Psychromonas sp.]